ncbi:alanine--glyoxylate aminotransferase family protein, partial [Streptomyces sp. NPDC059981]
THTSKTPGLEGSEICNRASHPRAPRATRAGAAALGVAPWVGEAAQAAPVATTLRVAEASAVVAKALAAQPQAPLAAGGGALAGEMVRVNHYGPAASPEAVATALRALASALSADPAPALAAASAAWR